MRREELNYFNMLKVRNPSYSIEKESVLSDELIIKPKPIERGEIERYDVERHDVERKLADIDYFDFFIPDYRFDINDRFPLQYLQCLNFSGKLSQLPISIANIAELTDVRLNIYNLSDDGEFNKEVNSLLGRIIREKKYDPTEKINSLQMRFQKNEDLTLPFGIVSFMYNVGMMRTKINEKDIHNIELKQIQLEYSYKTVKYVNSMNSYIVENMDILEAILEQIKQLKEKDMDMHTALKRQLDGQTMMSQLTLYADNASELKAFLKKILKSDIDNTEKEKWLEQINELLSFWSKIYPQRFKKIMNVLNHLEELADSGVLEKLKKVYSELMKIYSELMKSST